MIRKTTWAVPLILFSLFGASGCELFRAEIGSGFGIGADVKVPALLHGGASIGVFDNVGPVYAYGSNRRSLIMNLAFWHVETLRGKGSHQCLLFPWIIEGPDGARIGVDGHTFALEVGVMLLLFDLRLGVNFYPWAGAAEELPPSEAETAWYLPLGNRPPAPVPSPLPATLLPRE